jgi:hypothetical protein
MSMKRNRLEALERVKETLVEGWLAMTDQDLVDQVRQDGFEPEEARSRVLQAYQRAKQIVASDQSKAAAAGRPKKPRILNIDAAKARAILKDVACRSASNSLSWRTAAQLELARSDDEAIRAVGELKDLGIVSDDELK